MRVAAVPVLLLSVLIPLPVCGQTPYLVRDIDAREPFEQPSSEPHPLLTLQGRMFFVASEASTGDELWVTDGTSQGTQMLADACPGACGSVPVLAGSAGSLVFFTASSGAANRKVWRSDGTRRGTFSLSFGEIDLLADSPAPAIMGKTLFFSGCAGEASCGLWKTDGSQGGTGFVREIEGAFGSDVQHIAASGNRLFFLTGFPRAADLWTSDGTVGGTVRLKTIGEEADTLVVVGERVFLFGESDDLGGELWTSDGTEAGTRALTQFPGDPRFRWLKALGSKVYFIADDVIHGAELWTSDGTTAGTRRLTEFGFADPFPEFQSPAGHLEQLGSQLLFIATDGLTPLKVWTVSTSAAAAPARPLAAICPTTHSCLRTSDDLLVRAGDRVFFPVDDGIHGLEIWSTDGTPAGTSLMQDVCPGLCDSYQPGTLVSLLGSAFFRGSSSEGYDLWRSDGTSQGTRKFARRIGFPQSPSLAALGKTVFYAGHGTYGEELWASDGTVAGTRQVMDIARPAVSSRPHDLVVLGRRVVFSACVGFIEGVYNSTGSAGDLSPIALPTGRFGCDNSPQTVVAGGSAFFWHPRDFGLDLWSTTEDGTVSKLIDAVGTPLPLISLKGRLYFPGPSVDDSRLEIWTSDGTLQGTHRAFELPSDISLKFPPTMMAAGDELYFVARHIRNLDDALWRSDGTQSGTRKITTGHLNFEDLRLGRASTTVLFFTGSFRAVLWRTDGTAAGTVMISDDFRWPSVHSHYPTAPVSFQNAAYFLASNSSQHGLWRSDGTSGGTILVKSFELGPDDFGPQPPPQMTVLGNRLFFVAYDGVHGHELWASDGTAAGTGLVKDILPGPRTSEISNLRAGAGRVWFSANDGVHGFELWTSDGTAAGTRLVQDLAPLGASSFPAEPTVVGDRLVWSADDGLSGQELWALPLDGPAGCQPSPTALCLGGRFRVEAVWRDFSSNTGSGHAVALTADTGYFWFFDEANVEVVIKTLDAQTLNDHFWVFYGALSNVEYTLTVTDVQTGLTRRYFNPAGRFASVADTQGFGPLGAYSTTQTASAGLPLLREARTDLTAAKAPCVESSTRLCLNGGRFAVEAVWKIPERSGTAQAVRLTGDTGYFWFFDAANVEVMFKILDARPVNGKFWAFAGALSDVEYTITVTDTDTGRVKTYTNPKGRLASFGDVNAF